MSKTPVRIIKADQQDELDVWSLPNVQAKETTEQMSYTNALGKKSNWRYESPEEEIIAPEPLTAEEIEAIRQQLMKKVSIRVKKKVLLKVMKKARLKG